MPEDVPTNASASDARKVMKTTQSRLMHASMSFTSLAT